MRSLAAPAALALLLLAGCGGTTSNGTLAPLPNDFLETRSAAAGTPIQATYTIDVGSNAHLNSTLVWTGSANQLNIEVTAGGSSSGTGVASGTVAHLQQDLYPGRYVLKVTGTPQTADTWHLEAHFTRS